MSNIAESIAATRDRILRACLRAGRRPEEVRLIAVTKKVAVEKVAEASALGLVDFGENYVQEAKGKVEALGPGPTWHMIGHLQTNKAKHAARLFSYIHSIDRIALLSELERLGKPLDLLFEVNLSGEATKHGATEESLRGLLKEAATLRHVRPIGLMTMPPFDEDPEKSRPYFAALRELLSRVNKEFGMKMTELSMGMSADFEVAVEEGATMVRVGTAIFGERL
ncbi:MAG: YggS family pyridoxal phosphate-dependent enzyme [Syntrophorhabdales bacterium]